MSAIDLLTKHLAELKKVTGIEGRVVEQGSQVFVLLDAVPLPAGVARVHETKVLFITDHQYPLSAMDMFWVEVEVLRPDGSIHDGATSIERYLDRDWRRFSWHRNGVWNPAGNPLLDHFAFMEARWTKETQR